MVLLSYTLYVSIHMICLRTLHMFIHIHTVVEIQSAQNEDVHEGGMYMHVKYFTCLL